LEGADGVDRATGFAVLAGQENAIAAGFFGEAVVQADAAEVFLIEPSVGSAQEFRDPADFLLVGPDVPRITAAAVSALRTGELKPVAIPLFLSEHRLTLSERPNIVGRITAKSDMVGNLSTASLKQVVACSAARREPIHKKALWSGGPPPLEVGEAMIVGMTLSANHRLHQVRRTWGTHF